MKGLIFSLIFVFVMSAASVRASGADIVVNGQKIAVSPIIKSGRLLAPARAVFESVGANIEWNDSLKQITVDYDGTTVLMNIGNKIVVTKSADGEQQLTSDVAPEIIDGSAYVPVAVLAEILGGGVNWSESDKTAYINFSEAVVTAAYEKPFSMNCKGSIFFIDGKAEDADKILGGFYDESESIYGYKWRSYNPDTADYALIGINSGQIAAFYSNSKAVSIAGITPGMSSAQLDAALGVDTADTETIIINNNYGRLSIYRNSLDDYKVIAVMAQKTGNYAVTFNYDSNALSESAENMLFSIMNAERINKGLKPFIKDDEVAQTAREHSSFMSAGGSLTHDANGGSPFEKLTAKGITDYIMASENIGRDSADAIEMFAVWMNNKMYQSNIVSENYNYVGVGAWYGGKTHKMYFTADFIERQ